MENEIQKSGETMCISARRLHDRLRIATRFNDWFARMREYGFTEGEDFYSKMSKTEGRPLTDYDITVDMAKHICMLQRTEAGREVRQYLIDLEKAWNSPEQVLARALVVASGMIKDREAQIEEMQPKADYYDQLVDRNLLTNFRDTAKELRIGERKFIELLINRKYLYRDQGRKLKPYAARNDGYFELKEFASASTGKAGLQTLITPKGREKFRVMVKEVQDVGLLQ